MSSFYGNIVVNLNEGNTSLSSLQLDDNGNFYGLNEDSQRIAGPFNAVSTGINVIATLTYKNYDGSQTIATRSFINGIPQSEAPINPFRNATAQYEYSFAGWADNTNQTSGQLSISSLWHDKIVYAAYTATQRTYTVTWKDSNGTILETDSSVPYGTYPSYDGTSPNYNGQTFKEWSPSISNIITSDTQFTATYYNTYNVYFYSGQTLLDTVTVIEGQNATYSGTTPTKTDVNDPENYTFSGWSPLPNNIQANTTCYAQFTYTEPVVPAGVITDTWDEIFANTANGTYKTKYNIGDTKELDLGSQGVINMQIIAFDADDLADGNGKAPITWLSKQLLNTSHRMNPSKTANTSGTGTLGGWAASEMKAYYQNTIKPLIPSATLTGIVPVTKYTRTYQASDQTEVNNVSSSEDIWIPSRYQMFGTGSKRESQGVTYTSFFTNDASRIKMKLTSSSGINWWLRTAYSSTHFACVNGSGSGGSSIAVGSSGCALGFCTGGIAPSQSSVDQNGNILDSWDTIISNIDNGTYSTKYSIGNTKQLDLGTQGTVNMQIVAFDADALASGGGTAPITWINKELLATDHRMNPDRAGESGNYTEGTGAIGGWDKSEMRTYLRETIKPLIPSAVRSAIVEVTKYSRSYNTAGTLVNDVTTTDDVWIPSYREMFGNGETQGPAYSSAFPDAASCVKYKTGAASTSVWWLRSVNYSYSFHGVNSSGSASSNRAYNVGGIALGFCLGGTPSQTTDITDGAYGVEWDYSNSSPALTRKGLSANFADPSPATSLSGTGSSPFDNIQPWAGMKRYNIIDGAVSYSEDDAGFSETDYDTVVYIPEFYYFASKDTENSKWTWAISPTAKEGYSKHPGSGRYLGRYHTTGTSSDIGVKSGINPLASTSITNFSTYAANKGAKWFLMDIATWSALQMLYLIEFANFDSQTVLGTGNNSGSVKATGITDDAVYHTLKVSGNSNQYRWIENPFSNVSTWLDGFYAITRTPVITEDNTTRSVTASGKTSAGVTLPSTNGCIQGFGYSEDFPWAFIPDTSDGSTDYTKYVCDRVGWVSGSPVAIVGGNYGSNAIFGFFYLYAAYTVSETNALVGSRLLYKS